MLRFALTTLAVAGFVSAAHAQDADFTLINSTGYPLREVYVSPAHQDDWGQDRLGRSVLDNGESRTFRFPKNASQCVRDLKVVYDDDGSSSVWHNVDFCQIERVRLRYNRSTDTTTATAE